MEPHNKEARRGLDELSSPSTAPGSEGGATRGSINTEQKQHNTGGTPDTTTRLTHTPDTEAAQGAAPDKHTALEGTALQGPAAPQTAAPQPSPVPAREGTPPGPVSVETTAIRREGSGKKVKIVEVNSAVNASSAAKVVPNQIFPIDKPPHLRSKVGSLWVGVGGGIRSGQVR